MMYKLLALIFVFTIVNGFADWSEDQNPDKWREQAKNNIKAELQKRRNKNVAKNIIFYLGDGMGVTTVTAGRIMKGQMKGKNGEEEITVMESLDDSAFSKTYNIDAQTADSAGTATAYLSGVKTRIGVIGVDGRAIYGNCTSSLNAKVDSILQWAHKKGKSVGIVTTTRVTHATPAGAYAHIAHRDWEVYDGRVFGKKEYDEGCRDAAAQLIDDHPYINVIFGGGRRFFLQTTDNDYANDGRKGNRIDNRTLIDDWLAGMRAKNLSHEFIWNADGLRNLDIAKTDYVLGLFNYDHMEFESRRDNTKEPSLTEMTEAAIKILSKNKNGYFILVEGGKIDHAHHGSNAFNALHDYVAFDNAIAKGLEMTSKNETMITVTADHSHVFTMGGYSLRGNNILGLAYNQYNNLSDVKLTFTSLNYGNGPGGIRQIRTSNLTDILVESSNYVQESAVYLGSETHGGEDVPIFANGPMSFLFRGTVEQSYIAHAMAYSACIGPYDNDECLKNRGIPEEVETTTANPATTTTTTTTSTASTTTTNKSTSIHNIGLFTILVSSLISALIFN